MSSVSPAVACPRRTCATSTDSSCHHTDYDDRLLEAQMQTGTVEVDDIYRRIRRDAATAVDDFID